MSRLKKRRRLSRTAGSSVLKLLFIHLLEQPQSNLRKDPGPTGVDPCIFRCRLPELEQTLESKTCTKTGHTATANYFCLCLII